MDTKIRIVGDEKVLKLIYNEIKLMQWVLKAYDIITFLILTEKCANGDAKLDANSIPFLFWDGNWSSICGHWFWDNQHGVEAFCQKLGFKGGMFSKKNIPYKDDAIQVGKCSSEETIDSCTAAQNPYTKTGWCQAGYLYDGKHIGFTISCDGHTAGSEIQSCWGKIYNETKNKMKLQYHPINVLKW